MKEILIIAMISLISLSWIRSFATIALIGEERKPYTKEYAIANFIVTIIYTVALIYIFS